MERIGLSKRNWAFRTWLVLLATASVVVALELLGARFCGFTNFKDGTSGDYARYTNMIWNCGHGRPFLYSMDQSYLQVHLSFTLALLGVLFRVVDHPFLLAFLQWSLLVTGGVLLMLTARRLKLPWHFVLALIFFWVAHSFSQSVVLCEFHGVCTYFVLIPFLYYCLVWKKNWVWLPLCLILGLREEAGLMILPLLLYFAVKERWRAGYVYAGVAVVYVVVACYVLYPMINDGTSLFSARSHEISVPGGDDFGNPALWRPRLLSFLAIILPTLPFLWRGWKPLLVIPLVPVLVTLASSHDWQVNLKIHYTAVIMASLSVAMIEAARQIAGNQRIGAFMIRRVIPVCLVALSAWSFYNHGFVWGSRENKFNIVYQRISGDGLNALLVARRHVPKDGAVFTSVQLAGFVANRALVDSGLSSLSPTAQYPDAIVFCRNERLPDIYSEGVRDGEWGVRYFDDGYTVLQRGYKSDLSRDYLSFMGLPVVRFASTLHHAFVHEEYVEDVGTFRCWEGSAMKWPAVVAYGQSAELGPGRYVAEFVYKARAGKQAGKEQRDTGTFLLFVRDTETRIAEASIGVPGSDQLVKQGLPFEINTETEVEPRVYGGGASLSLLRVDFLTAPTEAIGR
jgi:uncharacterized membrane protein